MSPLYTTVTNCSEELTKRRGAQHGGKDEALELLLNTRAVEADGEAEGAVMSVVSGIVQY